MLGPINETIALVEGLLSIMTVDSYIRGVP